MIRASLTPLLALAVGCGGALMTPPEAELGPNPTGLLPEPSAGMQLVVPKHEVPPGSERTRCYHLNLKNPAPLDVVKIETATRVGLHHFNVFVSTLVREDGWGPCPGSIDLFVGARPIVDGSSAGVRYQLPPKVAFRVEPETLLIFQLHELNATSAAIPQEFVLNLHTDDAPDHVLADIYGFTNLDLHLPPKQRSVQTKDCTIEDPMIVVSMTSHFHARGVEAEAVLLQRGETQEASLYRTERWDNPEVQIFSPPVGFGVGDVLRFRCTYQNNDDHEVTYGGSAEDEMCFLFGYYYPKVGLIPCI